MSATPEPRLPRAARAAAISFALLGLLVVVALAARTGHPLAHGHVQQREVPARVGNDLLTLAVVVYAIGLVILVAAFVTFRHEWLTPRSRWKRDLLSTLLVCCFLTLVGYRLFHAHGPLQRRGTQQHQQAPRFGAGTSTRQGLPPLRAAKQPARFDWPFAAALAGLAALTAAFFLLRRPSSDEAAQEEHVEEELHAAVGDSIDDLRNERDARRAVIAAYARMERVLGRHGRARRPAEAPYEYLDRVLCELRVRPAAATELTDLFERAKFSVHPIDERMRERAIGALVAIRDDLAQA
jgi:hypothetical protein